MLKLAEPGAARLVIVPPGASRGRTEGPREEAPTPGVCENERVTGSGAGVGGMLELGGPGGGGAGVRPRGAMGGEDGGPGVGAAAPRALRDRAVHVIGPLPRDVGGDPPVVGGPRVGRGRGCAHG